MTFATNLSVFTPFLTNITGITNAQNAVVTTVENSPYSVGELISFRVSRPYGMTEINNLSGRVLNVSTNTFIIEINTLGFTAFVYPPVGKVIVPAVAVPAGSGIVPQSSLPMTNLTDAFDNVPVN